MEQSIINNLWKEKYRPICMQDFVCNEEVKKLIEKIRKEDTTQDLLFVSGPGTGKTTLAKMIFHYILQWEFLYINASKENGIDTIRNKVVNFAETGSFNGKMKGIILDEADGMSVNGNNALRSVIEEYSNNVRFILTCNNIYNISEAIKSRCQILYFSFNKAEYAKRLYTIAKSENINLDKQHFSDLINKCYPDLRQGIDFMQRNTSDNNLVLIDNTKNTELIKKIFSKIKNIKAIEVRQDVIDAKDSFSNDYGQLLEEMFRYLLTDSHFGEATIKNFLITISDFLYKDKLVNDREINFIACIIQLEKCL